MTQSLIKAVLVALTICAGGVLHAQENLIGAAPVATLVEEQILTTGDLEIPADGRIDLRLPQGLPQQAMRMEDFSFDPRSGMFAARIIDAEGGSLGFRGQAAITVPAYVPRRRIAAGTLLVEDDFRMAQVAIMALPAGALRSAQDIMGKEARRILLQDRPVLEGSVSEPRIVDRGDEVTIVLSNGGLNLSAPGKALEDGAKGEEVRIVNLKSNATLTAEIVSRGIVKVSPN